MAHDCRPGPTRRTLMTTGAAAALGTLAAPHVVLAQAEGSGGQPDAAAPTAFVIKGGYVLSMDAEIGDIETGDVLVRDGQIVEVAQAIEAAGVEVIDAANCVVMPGFVETHWHMWNAIWRGMANDASEYFALQSLSTSYTPEDHYAAVRYAALEALSAGITTCHNWSHGSESFETAAAEMQALVDAGIRAKMGYGAVRESGPVEEAELRQALDWITAHGQGRLGLGVILDGAGENLPALVQMARGLSLRPITDHGGLARTPELWGPELILTHGTSLTAEAIAALAASPINFGLCPGTDPMIGAGLPPILALIQGGVPLERISTTVDVTAQTPADPFAMMRTLVNAGRIQQAATPDLMKIATTPIEWAFGYRDALKVATSSGASVLGLLETTGTLTPGKRADVIVVRLDGPNMLPASNANPTFQLVQHGLPGNVDTVVVDGIIRKRGGAMLDSSVQEVVAAAAEAQRAIRERAGLPPIDTSR